MMGRFEGADGRRNLVEVLSRQVVVRGDAGIADELATAAKVRVLGSGEVLIRQDAEDNDVHFVLGGRVLVFANGREVAIRTAGQHVGEMAMIDPAAKRCATVFADGETIVASVSEAAFTAIASKNPELWRRLALELGERLRQRNGLIRWPNPRPALFIGSSAEAIGIVNEVESQLAHDEVLVRKWTTSVFKPSSFAIDDLLARIGECDLGLLVISPDDKVESRDKESDAPRDNVIFELGLCMGQLGRQRSAMLQPKGLDIKIPSDLLGLNPISYKVGPEGDVAAALGPAVTELRKMIKERGCR